MSYYIILNKNVRPIYFDVMYDYINLYFFIKVYLCSLYIYKKRSYKITILNVHFIIIFTNVLKSQRCLLTYIYFFKPFYLNLNVFKK